MIDHSLRQQRLLQEAKDPKTAVVLLDIVLGYSAHPDPASVLGKTIRDAKTLAQHEDRYLSVVTSICGTSQDPQDLNDQKKKLRDAGVIIMPSNAQAARMAALISTRGKAFDKLDERRFA